MTIGKIYSSISPDATRKSYFCLINSERFVLKNFIKKGATHFMWKILYYVLEKGWSLSSGFVWDIYAGLEF